MAARRRFRHSQNLFGSGLAAAVDGFAFCRRVPVAVVGSAFLHETIGLFARSTQGAPPTPTKTHSFISLPSPRGSEWSSAQLLTSSLNYGLWKSRDKLAFD